jgi:tetratricopeptide (TPR) repeat protein
LQQSLEIAQRLRSPSDISAALFSLGNTTRAQQTTQAALEFYQQAAEATTSPTTKVQAQLNQLSLLLETKQLSEAQNLWLQIQPQLVKLPLNRAAVYARINVAQSLMKLSTSESKEAAQLLATAVQQAKRLGDQRATAYALGNLGRLYEQTGQLSSAKELTEQALLLAQALNASDIAYSWQWQLGRLLKAQGDREGAIAAYTSAVNTLKSLRSDLVSINPDVQFSFRESVEPVYRELVSLLLQSQGTQSNQKNLEQARDVIESLQLAELVNFFREDCLNGTPIQIDQVDPQAVVIYPIVLEDRLEVVLSLPKAPLRHYSTLLPKAEWKVSLLSYGKP